MDLLRFLQLDAFDASDPLAVAVVVVLACLLSCDNAVVLALLVRDLPRPQQARALTYGLIGAYVFRVVALILAVWIMSKWYLKILGGVYLLYLAVRHLARGEHHRGPRAPHSILGLSAFWSTVLVVELADVVFSIDSIAASIALTQKLWVLILGSAIGMAVMRFAAHGFVLLLERFPRLETAAFIAVGVVGLQLLLEFPVDVVGLTRPEPAVAYATAEEWSRAVDQERGRSLAIPGVLTLNLAAPPPPAEQTLREAQERLLRAEDPALDEAEVRRRAEARAAREHRLAHARWNLHDRPLLDLDGWISSLLIIAIFAVGFAVPQRRAP
jgi:YkoY family integral membrane protein